jgi:hypothetical protein
MNILVTATLSSRKRPIPLAYFVGVVGQDLLMGGSAAIEERQQSEDEMMKKPQILSSEREV